MFIDVHEVKRQVSVVEFLSRLGHEPVRKSAKEHFYRSMVRESDTVPSFCVNEAEGIWYDHGSGEGGTIIELAQLVWPELPFNKLLQKIVETCNLTIEIQSSQKDMKEKYAKVPNYGVFEIREAGNNPVLTNYMKYRGVWNPHHPGYKEVYYYIEDTQGHRKPYFAAGWQNEHGSWEVRNKYFKGCLGPKGLTLVYGDPGRLSVFEGYMDYLSCLIEEPRFSDTALVLNGTAFIKEAIMRAEGFSQIRLFFDHGAGGRVATQTFLAARPDAMDASSAYIDFDDYNEKLMKANHRNQESINPSQNGNSFLKR